MEFFLVCLYKAVSRFVFNVLKHSVLPISIGFCERRQAKENMKPEVFAEK